MKGAPRMTRKPISRICATHRFPAALCAILLCGIAMAGIAKAYVDGPRPFGTSSAAPAAAATR